MFVRSPTPPSQHTSAPTARFVAQPCKRQRLRINLRPLTICERECEFVLCACACVSCLTHCAQLPYALSRETYTVHDASACACNERPLKARLSGRAFFSRRRSCAQSLVSCACCGCCAAVLVSVSALRCSALLLALPYALLVLCSCCTLRACSLVAALALLSPAADARASTALIDLRSRFLHTKKIKKTRST